MSYLFLYQFVCLNIFLLLAVILLLSRFFQQQTYARYEKSRWILFAAMMLLSTHYAAQIRYGFRAMGDDVGSIINCLFYTPVMCLMSYTHLNLIGTTRWKRTYWMASICIGVLLYGSFWGGYVWYGSLIMPMVQYFIWTLFLISSVLFVSMTVQEVARMRKRLEAETGNRNEAYARQIYADTAVLTLSTLIIPFAILGMPWLLVGGVMCLLGAIVYVVGFLCLGFYVRPISEVVDDVEQEEENPITARPELTDERLAQIESALEEWIRVCSYRDSSATLSQVARQTGLPRRELSLYLDRQKQCTFRIWLSMIRLEVAKKMLLEHPEYSNEVVALECGFSSRSQLYNVFREYTGKTPREWMESVRTDG